VPLRAAPGFARSDALFAGMVASGALSGATMAWHEGAPAWVPIDQLLGGGALGGSAAAGGAAGGSALARGAVLAAAPVRADDPEAQLRAFQSEVARLEDAEERPGTPECVQSALL
jgi:hypothetical protein